MKHLVLIFFAIICCGVVCADPQKPKISDVFSANFIWAEASPYSPDSFNVYANGNISIRSDYISGPNGVVSTTYWQFFDEHKEYIAEYQPYACYGHVYQETYQSFWFALASATYVGQKTIQKTVCDYWEFASGMVYIRQKFILIDLSEATKVEYCFANNGTLPVYFKQTWRNADPISYYINNFVPTVDPGVFKVPCA